MKKFGSTAVHGKTLLVTNASCFLAIFQKSWIQHNKKYFWSHQCLTFLVAGNLCTFLDSGRFEIFLLKSNISLFNSHYPFITLTPQLEVVSTLLEAAILACLSERPTHLVGWSQAQMEGIKISKLNDFLIVSH